jgi:hypothetical protein
MKNKIIGIFVCMLVMITAFSPSLPGEIRSEQNPSLLTLTNPLIVSMLENISENQVIENINELTSLGPRFNNSRVSQTAAKMIYDQFSQEGLQVRYHNWSYIFYSGINVEATLLGHDQSSSEIYIICGHYDTVWNVVGADDNAGGTSAVLIASDVLSTYTFNHTIRFIAFSGEEEGLVGSYEYVKEAVENKDNIAGVLNLDMIGYAPTQEDANKIGVYDQKVSYWLTNFTSSISTEYFPYINLQVIHKGSPGISDHLSFTREKYPAVLYWEYIKSPAWHQKNDTLENMNPSYATKVTKLGVATLATLAEPIIGAPLKPNQPSGQINGKIEQEYTYTTSTTDPDGDQVFYRWDWGDGSYSDWLGPYDSGATIDTIHKWTIKGSFSIKVKAKDSNGHESSWSSPLPITMPYSYKPIPQFFDLLFQRFPNAFPLLRQLMGY